MRSIRFESAGAAVALGFGLPTGFTVGGGGLEAAGDCASGTTSGLASGPASGPASDPTSADTAMAGEGTSGAGGSPAPRNHTKPTTIARTAITERAP